jgi:hypothetical protein
MKNKLMIMAGAVAVMVSFTASVQALPLVTGGISLAGGVGLDTLNAQNANVLTFNNVDATGESGSFVGITPTFVPGSITMNGFTISPFVSVLPLWYVTANNLDFFNLTALTLVDRSVNNALTLTGTGMIDLVGYAPTPGIWTFTANSGGGTFSFSSSNFAAPDGGATVMLLGAALTAMGLLRKKLAA